MIDQWFKKDLHAVFDTHSVVVFIDESGDAKFLLKTVANEFTIYQADTEVEELHVKYLIEQTQPTHKKFLIHTRSSKENLKFIREYCETNGCLEIRYLQNYIKEKVHEILNLNINLSKEELIAAAKISVGKNKTYWMDLCHKGAAEIFDLKKELLPFVHDPETYSQVQYDEELKKTFYGKVSELLGQKYIAKPAQTLADEVTKAMLDGLACKSCDETLESVYCAWLDSVSYRDSFSGYLDNYTLPADIDIWKVNPSHPFRTIDEQWLKVIGKNINNKEKLPLYIEKISLRSRNKQAQALNISFWNDVIRTDDEKSIYKDE